MLRARPLYRDTTTIHTTSVTVKAHEMYICIYIDIFVYQFSIKETTRVSVFFFPSRVKKKSHMAAFQKSLEHIIFVVYIQEWDVP